MIAVGSSPRSNRASTSSPLQLPRFALPPTRSSGNSANAASHSGTKSIGWRQAFELLAATRTDYLVHETRQDCRRMFPADDIEALKGLICEIQCVTAICKIAVCDGDEH